MSLETQEFEPPSEPHDKMNAGSVILDCILSLDPGFIVDNSALRVPFYDLSILLQSNLRFQKLLHLLATEIHTHIRNSVSD